MTFNAGTTVTYRSSGKTGIVVAGPQVVDAFGDHLVMFPTAEGDILVSCDGWQIREEMPVTWKNSYPTGTKARFYAYSDKNPTATSCEAVMAAGPVDMWAYEMGARTMAMLTADGRPENMYLMNITNMQCVVEVQPDGFETGTEVSIKCAGGRWLMGHVAAGPLTERASVSAARRNVIINGNTEVAVGLVLVLTENGHVQNLSTSRLFPY